MSYIYVYTNKYFNNENYRKIGCTFNPFIRLETYLTYYLDRGKFEFLFKIETKNLFQIEKKIKTEYLLKHNSRNNGFDGGTEIFQNNKIRFSIINCFKHNNIKWEELDPTNPPITKKYINVNEKKLLSEYRKTTNNILFNQYNLKIPSKEELLEELKPLQIKKSKKLLELCKNIEIYLNVKKPKFYYSYLIYQNSYLGGPDNIKTIRSPSYLDNPMLEFDKHELNIIDYDGNFIASFIPNLTESGFCISNSIVIFDVEISDYKCNNIKNNSSDSRISDLVFDNKSKVGTPYGRIEIPEIRKSTFCTSIFDLKGPSTKRNLKQLVIENIKHIVPKDDIDNIYWNTKLKYTVLEYNKGDFFLEHSDSKKNKKHYATLLIFPPSENDLLHTGGNLIIKTDVTDVVFCSSLNNMKTSNGNDNWKFVAFHSNLKHECLPLLSGRRVVLKTELMFKTNHFKHFIEPPSPEPEACD